MDGEIELRFPKHRFAPKELLSFIEMPGFSADWASLGFNDDALDILQVAIMANPKTSRHIPGTDGLQKVELTPEFAEPPKEKVTAHVYFAYYEEFGVVLLIKASRIIAELNPQQKMALALTIAEQREEFAQGPVRFRNNK